MKLDNNKQYEQGLDQAFNLFQADFKDTLDKNFAAQKPDFFQCVYPLFVLLESLTNPDYFTNPNAEILLQKAFEQGNNAVVRVTSRRLVLQETKSEENMLLRQGLLERYITTPYYEELYSDCLILLNAYYTNHYRGAYIALRTILEDLHRHLYYKDHLQEFCAIQQNENYDEHTHFSLGYTNFNKYLKSTDFLKVLCDYNKKFDKQKANNIFNWSAELYSDTSSYIHASKMQFMSHFKSNSNIKFDENLAKNLKDTTKEVITLAIVLLICAHRPTFLRFSDYSKFIILTTFVDNKTRINFRKALNV